MSLDLFDGARSEVVAGREHDGEPLLLEEIGDLSEIRRLADSVDADEGDHVGLALLPRPQRLRNRVDDPLRRQDLRERVLQRVFHDFAD